MKISSPLVRAYLKEVYLDWANNYLTPAKFAEHNGITKAQAIALIELAREVYNSPHPDE